MPALTPDERRGGLLVVLLLLIGAAWDFWRAASPPPRGPEREWVAHSATPADSGARVAGLAAPDTARRGDPRVDLNRADARELDELPGIGPVLAARIVEHRRRHGAFRSMDELRAVRGVGPRLLERLKTHARIVPE